MTLWGVNRNVPTTRDSFPRFTVTGPDAPLSGNITRIWVLVHWRIGAGIPLKSTASSPGFRWPNPIPEITTGFPKGPSVGSRVMGVMTVTVTGALVLYPTEAQQDPSGKGSTEASRTSRGPVVAFDGTFTSIRVSRQRTTSAAMPLMSTSFTPVDTNLPNPSPVIVTVMPIAPESGLIAGAAHAPSHAKTTTRTVPRRAPVVRPRSLFIVSTPRVSKEVSHYNIGFRRGVKVGGSGMILGLWRAGQPVLFLRRGNSAWLPSPGRTRRSAPTESARGPCGAT